MDFLRQLGYTIQDSSSVAVPEQYTTGSVVSAEPAGTNPISGDDNKVKRTRKRKRLSCVECAVRRQKCDRGLPCSSCTSRGVPDLCRFEAIFARPPPLNRSKALAAKAHPSKTPTIEALLSRIAELEEALSTTHIEDPSVHFVLESPVDGVTSSLSSKFNPQSHYDDFLNIGRPGSPVILLHQDIHVSTVASAHLSLAPRSEFVGHGATVVSAVNKLGNLDVWEVPYTHSSTMRLRRVRESRHPMISPIRDLVTQLPSKKRLNELLDIFFITRNADFGIYEDTFRSATDQMWFFLQKQCVPGCEALGGCPGCMEEVNPHWLTLIFAVLALTPLEHGGQESATYFRCALKAKGLVDDILLGASYPVSENTLAGSVVGCYGNVVMAAYLADHGRVSEAWKIIGNNIRYAQALGLHREPANWEQMGLVESDLRLCTWWALVMADRQYSFILGRPIMTPKGSFELISLPSPANGEHHFAMFKEHRIKLFDILSDISTQCPGWRSPSYEKVLEINRSFQRWEYQLPPCLKWRTRSAPRHIFHDAPAYMTAYQSVTFAAYYLDALIVVYRMYIMEQLSIGPDKCEQEASNINASRGRCASLALELTSVLVNYFVESSRWPAKQRVFPNLFEHFLLDAAITLAVALPHVPDAQIAECLEMTNRALQLLQGIATKAERSGDGEGELAKSGVSVLQALIRAGLRGESQQAKVRRR